MSNAFNVLDRMCENDEKGEFIKAFMSPENLISAYSGKEGWGTVTIAVDNKTVMDIANDKPIKLALFVYDTDEFLKTKEKIESE